MPHQAVLFVEYPVVLIWEVEEATRNAPFLEDVEDSKTIRHRETVVKIAVDDEHWGGEL